METAAERPERPCAVIGPDRIAPPQHQHGQRHQARSWHVAQVYPQAPGNISPRRTFQENMSRIVIPSPNGPKDGGRACAFAQSPGLEPSAYYPAVPDRRYCEAPSLYGEAYDARQRPTQQLHPSATLALQQHRALQQQQALQQRPPPRVLQQRLPPHQTHHQYLPVPDHRHQHRYQYRTAPETVERAADYRTRPVDHRFLASQYRRAGASPCAPGEFVVGYAGARFEPYPRQPQLQYCPRQTYRTAPGGDVRQCGLPYDYRAKAEPQYAPFPTFEGYVAEARKPECYAYAARPSVGVLDSPVELRYPALYRQADERIFEWDERQKYYCAPKGASHNPLAGIPTDFSPNVISPAGSGGSPDEAAASRPPAEQPRGSRRPPDPEPRAKEAPALSLKRFFENWDEEYEDPPLPSERTERPAAEPAAPSPARRRVGQLPDSVPVPVRSAPADCVLVEDVPGRLRAGVVERPDCRVRWAPQPQRAPPPQVFRPSRTAFAPPLSASPRDRPGGVGWPPSFETRSSAPALRRPPDPLDGVGDAFRFRERRPVDAHRLRAGIRAGAPEDFCADELIDVEAKISQSVIHKDVGCNFEIRPCSPAGGRGAELPLAGRPSPARGPVFDRPTVRFDAGASAVCRAAESTPYSESNVEYERKINKESRVCGSVFNNMPDFGRPLVPGGRTAPLPEDVSAGRRARDPTGETRVPLSGCPPGSGRAPRALSPAVPFDPRLLEDLPELNGKSVPFIAAGDGDPPLTTRPRTFVEDFTSHGKITFPLLSEEIQNPSVIMNGTLNLTMNGTLNLTMKIFDENAKTEKDHPPQMQTFVPNSTVLKYSNARDRCDPKPYIDAAPVPAIDGVPGRVRDAVDSIAAPPFATLPEVQSQTAIENAMQERDLETEKPKETAPVEPVVPSVIERAPSPSADPPSVDDVPAADVDSVVVSNLPVLAVEDSPVVNVDICENIISDCVSQIDSPNLPSEANERSETHVIDVVEENHTGETVLHSCKKSDESDYFLSEPVVENCNDANTQELDDAERTEDKIENYSMETFDLNYDTLCKTEDVSPMFVPQSVIMATNTLIKNNEEHRIVENIASINVENDTMLTIVNIHSDSNKLLEMNVVSSIPDELNDENGIILCEKLENDDLKSTLIAEDSQSIFSESKKIVEEVSFDVETSNFNVDECTEISFAESSNRIKLYSGSDDREIVVYSNTAGLCYDSADRQYNTFLAEDSCSADSDNYKGLETVMLCENRNSDASSEVDSVVPLYKEKTLENNLDDNGLEMGGCWIDDIACVETVISEDNRDDSVEYDSSMHRWENRSVEEYDSSYSNIDPKDEILKDSNGNVIDDYAIHEKPYVMDVDTKRDAKDQFDVDISKEEDNYTELEIFDKNVEYESKYEDANIYERIERRLEELDSTDKVYMNNYEVKRKNKTSKKYKNVNRKSEKRDGLKLHLNPGRLKTKGAQKYIPPIDLYNHNLKCHLPLPTNKSLLEKLNGNAADNDCSSDSSARSRLKNRMVLPKKPPKPRFEDVLKNIDESTISQIKLKLKKNKSIKKIPKMIIKKNEQGSHYASMPDRRIDDSELAANKWQPQVCLQRSACIENMVRNKP